MKQDIQHDGTVAKAVALEEFDKMHLAASVTLIAAVVVFVIWAALFKLDVMSLSVGSVEPISKVQNVQHLEGGIVKKLLVKEGDNVVAGQPLVELESVASGADVGEIRSRQAALQANIMRLNAELADDKALELPQDFQSQHPSLSLQVIDLFNARRKTLDQRIAAQEDETRLRRLEIEEIKARSKYAEERLVLVNEQLAISEELIKLNLSNRFEHMERLKEQNELAGSIAVDKAAMEKAKKSMEQAENKIASIKTEYFEDVETQKSQAVQELAELKQRLDKYEDNLSRTVLRAPMAGVVKSLFVSTEGGVIAPGGTVLDIVPGDQSLIIEAKLPPQDIGHVTVGQKAIIQLASSEASVFGKIEGTVMSISPDTHTTDQGEIFYIVRVQTRENKFRNKELVYELTPGVMVTAAIVTGRRSVMQYMLSPFLGNLSFALSEQ